MPDESPLVRRPILGRGVRHPLTGGSRDAGGLFTGRRGVPTGPTVAQAVPGRRRDDRLRIRRPGWSRRPDRTSSSAPPSPLTVSAPPPPNATSSPGPREMVSSPDSPHTTSLPPCASITSAAIGAQDHVGAGWGELTESQLHRHVAAGARRSHRGAVEGADARDVVGSEGPIGTEGRRAHGGARR